MAPPWYFVTPSKVDWMALTKSLGRLGGCQAPQAGFHPPFPTTGVSASRRQPAQSGHPWGPLWPLWVVGGLLTSRLVAPAYRGGSAPTFASPPVTLFQAVLRAVRVISFPSGATVVAVSGYTTMAA